MRILPAPETCDWFEAQQTAETLEALACELFDAAGPRPKRGFRKVHLWNGKITVINGVRYRAMKYRLRQGLLQDEAK